MPPLPAVFDADSLALAETIERGLNDLSTFQILRLRTCTGPLTTQQLWAAEIREDVEKLGAQIEVRVRYVYALLDVTDDSVGEVQELDVLVDDQRTERTRRELRLRVDTFRDTLNECVFTSIPALRFLRHTILIEDFAGRSQTPKRLPSSGSCIKTCYRCTTAVPKRRATI